MTDQERARALSGATLICPGVFEGEATSKGSLMLVATMVHDERCCKGRGRVPLLDPKRARKACPGRLYCADHLFAGNATRSICGGTGWLSTLLEEPELCTGMHPGPSRILFTCPICGQSSDSVGIVQAWRLQLLIELLEGAGVSVDYGRCLEGVHNKKCWYVSFTHEAHGRVLAVAACEALGIGTEVKSEPADAK